MLLTLAIFALTLGLVLTRPRGMSEAWATVLGASLMLGLGRETMAQAWQTISQGGDVLLFLLGLLIFSDLLRAAGFFKWAAIHAAAAAAGDGRVLYRNVFILGAVTTALLSLDTTAVILTPVVLGFVERLRLKPLPFLLACAFVANTASLLLPVSNLTNLLFVSALGWSFAAFAVRMALPQAVALLVNYWLLRRRSAADLPVRFAAADLPEPASVLPDVPYFRGAVGVLAAVLVGYFLGTLWHVPPYTIALTGCVLLFAWGCWRRQVSWTILRDISWPLFPFIIGLFVVVRGVQNLGLAALAARGVALAAHSTLGTVLVTAFGAGLGSNVVNNIPMALLALSALRQAPMAAQYGALLGCNLGPNLTITGSLATMLVITSARRHGVTVSAADFFGSGVRVTPVLLLVTSVVLWLTFLPG